MAVPDHASPLAPRNHSLARITVVTSLQTRTRATMLALTSHYSATNAKHPRHAPCWERLLGAPAGPRASAATRTGRRLRELTVPSPHCLTVTTSPASPLTTRASLDPAGPMFHRAGHSRPDAPSGRPWDGRADPGTGGRGAGRGGARRDGRHSAGRGGARRGGTGGGAWDGVGAGWAEPRRGGREAEPGAGAITEGGNNPSCSDIRARNRTRFANVSLGTDGANRGRPPGPGAIQ